MTPPLSWRIPRFLLFALLTLACSGLALLQLHAQMAPQEVGLTLLTCFGALLWGWRWPAIQIFLPICASLAGMAISLYAGQFGQDHPSWILQYALASQSAVLWMAFCFFLATLLSWGGLVLRSPTCNRLTRALTWIAAGAALVALLVRWHETYLLSPDAGHIPIANLYEVSILLCLCTALLYLYYDQRFNVRSLGALILPIILATVVFLIWLSLSRQGQIIQPLVPALQSWWMKIHVPANLIGYGAFCLAAALGLASILSGPTILSRRTYRALLTSSTAVLTLTIILLATNNLSGASASRWVPWGSTLGFTLALLFLVTAFQGRLRPYLPPTEQLNTIAYEVTALGFLFFTLATITGAIWAAEAWGAYWQWDPKETWALIVWLNYAAWLHGRQISGWRHSHWLAWWLVIGFLIATFTFLGVNLFLSGLHSYGNL